MNKLRMYRRIAPQQSHNVQEIFPRQQRRMQAQNLSSARVGHEQTQNVQADRPPTTQPDSMHQQQMHQQQMHQPIVFEPQQPPTYEEITQDTFGAFDGNSVAESTSSDIVPIMKGGYSTGELDSSMASSSIVAGSRGALNARVAFDGNSDTDSVSNAGSIVSRT